MYSCFHSVGLPSRPLGDVIQLAANAGYKAIELNAETLPWAPPHITPDADVLMRQAILAAAQSRKMPISAVGAHIQMVSPSSESRSLAVGYVKGCIDLARDLGSPVVHILSGPLESGVDENEAWSWFRSAVEQTTDYAKKQNIDLGIEAIAGHVFHCVDDYHRMLKELPGVPFKVNFDPSHLEVQNEDPMRVVNELGDQIIHVHFKDGKGLFPKFEFPPLGKGSINFSALAKGLLGAGYKGAISHEYEAQVFGYKMTDIEILEGGKTFIDALI